MRHLKSFTHIHNNNIYNVKLFEDFFKYKNNPTSMYNIDYVPKDIKDCKKYVLWLEDHIIRKDHLQLDKEIEEFCKRHDHANMLSLDECIEKVGYEQALKFIEILKGLHYK